MMTWVASDRSATDLRSLAVGDKLKMAVGQPNKDKELLIVSQKEDGESQSGPNEQSIMLFLVVIRRPAPSALLLLLLSPRTLSFGQFSCRRLVRMF